MHKKNPIARPLLLSGLGLLFAASQPQASPQQLLPNYSAYAERSKNTEHPLSAGLSTQASTWVDTAQPLAIENALGVPTFLWAAGLAGTKAAPHTAASITTPMLENAARAHLARYADAYRLSPAALHSAKLHHVHNIGDNGIVVRLTQQVDGIDVFERRIDLLMDRSLALTAISGYLAPQIPSSSQTASALPPFQLTIQQAISAAFNDLYAENLPANLLVLEKQRAPYQWYALRSPVPKPATHTLTKPVRAKRVYYALPDRLEPAYYLELDTTHKDGGGDTAAYAYVISAVNGELLSRNTLIESEATAYTYRVWAEDGVLPLPYDSPYGNDLTPFPAVQPTQPATPVTANLITLSCGPLSSCDPWLPPTATQTVGNNVDAYADINTPSGFNKGDLRAPLNSPYAFAYAYDFSVFDDANSPTQIQAAIVQAFYTTNFLHDWLYDHGFNEQAGNGQDQNYGRGGEEVDRMKVEVNDYGGTNNANMNTPLDGEPATMQLYLWTHNGAKNLTVTDASGANKKYRVSTAEFGPQDFRLNGGKIVAVDDGEGTATDACQTPFSNASDLVGAIALIDRGSCLFVEKVKHAQDAGAIGAIIANNAPGAMIPMGGTDSTISIPTLGINQTVGNTIKQAIATANPAQLDISATMLKKQLAPYNSALDNTIIVHEWGHFLSHRLIGSIANNQGRAMGEGWSDFLALLAIVKEEDRQVENNAQFQGTYAIAQYVADNQPRSYYFGIRRYPYSTDLNKNPLTFKHIMNGVALPTGIPVAFYDPFSNAELHSSGEVWASMLWEAYAELLNDNGRLSFRQAQDRMLDYLVASLKLTPADPTFLEARDALLAVAKVRDPADYAAFWRAFAKRGAGVHAKGPKRYSMNHAGVVEDFSTP
ncbi:MAG: M36 family metallopeptidase [Methylovulum sp.]|nr:M36 family metallopeptidase [Methylovulum sp.]